MLTCNKCGKTFPFKIKIDGKIRHLGKRKYCLECSPFGLHNTKKLINYSNGLKKCSKCGLMLPLTEFYDKYKRSAGYCKKCFIKDIMTRYNDRKILMIKYKGGKCERCGYNKCIQALEFHHKDTTKKEISINNVKKSTLEAFKKEVDKCTLLCANCHREEHYNPL